jgi:epoxyqueuosine reductase QueG
MKKLVETGDVMDSSEIKEFARQCGADLVGVADLSRLKGIQTEPENLLEDYKTAISMALALADGVIDPIEDKPTPLYQQHYYKVNLLLDDIGLRVSGKIQEMGGKALPIPASQLLDLENWTSYISHKAVAIAAGLGWQGKSLLVVTPEYGPRVRLVTVLTDLPFDPDEPVKNLCARCSECADACPAGAIKNVNTDYHYESRNEALDFDKCVARVSEENPKLPFIDSPICGVCIRACPQGKKRRKRERKASLLSKDD